MIGPLMGLKLERQVNSMDEDLEQTARDAITAVFSDRSCSQAEAYKRLDELIGFIQTMQDTLEVE